jgi:hypothetical protein
MPEKLIASYPYRDARGRLLFTVERYQPKRFAVLSVKKKVLPDFPRPLVPYCLPELLAADPSDTVSIVEGEKDVDTLRELGLVATTNPGGCRLGWQPDYGQYLKGRHVVVLSDNDNPGRGHAEKVADMLRGVAASVVTVPLPGLPGAGDVSDWLARPGCGLPQLLDVVRKARYAVAGLTRSPIKMHQIAMLLLADVSAQEKLVLLGLYHMGAAAGPAPLTARGLADRLGLHRVTVQNTIGQLRHRGILRRHPEGHDIAWDILALCLTEPVVDLAVAEEKRRQKAAALSAQEEFLGLTPEDVEAG